MRGVGYINHTQATQASRDVRIVVGDRQTPWFAMVETDLPGVRWVRHIDDANAGFHIGNVGVVASHCRSCFPCLFLFLGHEGKQALRLPVCRTCKGLKSRPEFLWVGSSMV